MTLTRLLSAATFALALTAAPAWADDHAPPPDHPDRAEFCKNSPVTCEVGDESRRSRKEWCEKNAEKCQALKDERKARRDRMKAACEADPVACEKKKAEMRERFKERRERRKERADAPPAPAN